MAGSGAASVGGAGLDPGLARGPCSAYCPGYGSQCVQRLMGQDCMAACQAEVNSFGPRCQTLGIAALRCLTPFFTPNGFGCDDAVNRALTQCGKIVADFQTCKGVDPTPSPTMPLTNVTSCPGMGTTGPTRCMQVYACAQGLYEIDCTFPVGTGAASCSCSMPSGATTGTSFPNDGMACARAAIELCR